jgi:hypothetical protein
VFHEIGMPSKGYRPLPPSVDRELQIGTITFGDVVT